VELKGKSTRVKGKSKRGQGTVRKGHCHSKNVPGGERGERYSQEARKGENPQAWVCSHAGGRGNAYEGSREGGRCADRKGREKCSGMESGRLQKNGCAVVEGGEKSRAEKDVEPKKKGNVPPMRGGRGGKEDLSLSLNGDYTRKNKGRQRAGRTPPLLEQQTAWGKRKALKKGTQKPQNLGVLGQALNGGGRKNQAKGSKKNHQRTNDYQSEGGQKP